MVNEVPERRVLARFTCTEEEFQGLLRAVWSGDEPVPREDEEDE